MSVARIFAISTVMHQPDAKMREIDFEERKKKKLYIWIFGRRDKAKKEHKFFNDKFQFKGKTKPFEVL
jgi:hypothetical protein